jgi:hypothetical protein
MNAVVETKASRIGLSTVVYMFIEQRENVVLQCA